MNVKRDVFGDDRAIGFDDRLLLLYLYVFGKSACHTCRIISSLQARHICDESLMLLYSRMSLCLTAMIVASCQCLRYDVVATLERSEQN